MYRLIALAGFGAHGARTRWWLIGCRFWPRGRARVTPHILGGRCVANFIAESHADAAFSDRRRIIIREHSDLPAKKSRALDLSSAPPCMICADTLTHTPQNLQPWVPLFHFQWRNVTFFLRQAASSFKLFFCCSWVHFWLHLTLIGKCI